MTRQQFGSHGNLKIFEFPPIRDDGYNMSNFFFDQSETTVTTFGIWFLYTHLSSDSCSHVPKMNQVTGATNYKIHAIIVMWQNIGYIMKINVAGIWLANKTMYKTVHPIDLWDIRLERREWVLNSYYVNKHPFM